MQKQFIKNIYQEFVYCDPEDHLLKPNNNLTKPIHNLKNQTSFNHKPNPINNDEPKVITIQSDITGHYSGASAINCNKVIQNITPIAENNKTEPEKPFIYGSKDPQPMVYDEDTFNQIELRGFITKELLRESLEKGSNLFHIGKELFDELHNKYHEFKEILHTLTTEFDNTIECIIETGKELTKKINHIIYKLYLAVMNKKL